MHIFTDGNLDLESFGKKKKKKKKQFNMDELESALPDDGTKSKDDLVEFDVALDETQAEENIDLAMDFSGKKKKKKKKDLDELVAAVEKEKFDKDNKENGWCPFNIFIT